MTISFHFDILLGFLIFGISLSSIYLTAYLIINFYFLFTLLMININHAIHIFIILAIFYFIYFLYSQCSGKGLSNSFNLLLLLFSYIPLGIKLVIIVRLLLFVFSLSDFFLDSFMYSTSGDLGNNGLKLPPLAGGDGSSGSTPPKLPPLPLTVSDFQSRDPITYISSNQESDISNRVNNFSIFDQRHNYHSRFDPHLQREFLDRYRNSGDTSCVERNGRLVYRNATQIAARMNPTIFEAVRRGGV